MIVSPEYKANGLSLNRSPLNDASLKWLQDMNAIGDEDLHKFEHIKKCCNTLAQEMLAFASSGVDFNVAEAFDEMVGF